MVSVKFPQVTQKALLHRMVVGVIVVAAAAPLFGQISYSGSDWTQWTGSGPWGGALHLSSTANATATIVDTGTEAFVVHKTGSDCGIMRVVVDGQTASAKEIDTYSSAVLWNKKTVIASNLANGPHTIVVTVTGRKNSASSGALVQLIDKWTLARGQWSCEKAWAWYQSKPWIVGWNYTPSTCVNSTEWWQDETHVSDSSINRELGLGEQLGYNAIVVYLQYLVWDKDSAYLKSRFNRFLDIAAGHHMSVTPVFFDDVNFKGGEPSLGDQGEPKPGILMSQWTTSPGPDMAMSPSMRPRLQRYVQDMVRTFGQDNRILMWNVYNEPGNSGMGVGTFPLVELTFQWIRQLNPSQPSTCSEWGNYVNPWPYDLSDICSFHGYTDNAGLTSAIAKLRATQRPIMSTEWLARKQGSNIPVDLPLFKRLGVGCFSWGLINGRMQCQYPWSNKLNGSVDPTGWFHDILYNSGRPYRPEEVDAIRRNLAHKTINWAAGTMSGALVAKNGCTDPRYAQYDSMATVDNGSCSTLLSPLVIRGCLDSTSKNYAPLATLNDATMCGAVGVTSPVRNVDMARQEGWWSAGNNQIRIFGPGGVSVEVVNLKGAVVWAGNGNGPCTFSMKKKLNAGIYLMIISRNGRGSMAPSLFRVRAGD